MQTIKIVDLHKIYKDSTFELFIRSRKEVRTKFGKLYKLVITVNNCSYEIWQPKNKIWNSFSPQVGIGMICKVENYEDRYFIKPIEQLLVIKDTTQVLDLYDLPYESGDKLTLGCGIASTKNQTQYMLLLDDKGTNLIRVPSTWEEDIKKLQYKVIDIEYKRTAKKGFLTLIGVVEDLEPADINKLFKGRK